MARRKLAEEDAFISVILVCDVQSKAVVKDIKWLAGYLSPSFSNYEVIVIDNGLPDKVAAGLKSALNELACVRVIRLSRPTLKDTAVFAGLESAIGDKVVILTQGVDRVNIVPRFINRSKSSEIVLGVSSVNVRNGFMDKYGARMFYWYNRRYLGIGIPANSTYFMVLSRSAVNSLTRSERHARHIRYLVREVGYSVAELVYKPNLKHEIPRRKARDLLGYAVQLTTGYSKMPLRLVSLLGLAAAIINLVYGLYVVLIKLFKNEVAEGWTTMSLQSAVMFFLLFLILAVLSEYIGCILDEVRGEPPYHIAEEVSSATSLSDAMRRNIAR